MDAGVNRFSERVVADDYVQAGDLFRLSSAEDKTSLIRNIANGMRGLPEHIIKLQISHFTKADPAYGRPRRSRGSWCGGAARS
ncbi:MAG TPA: catalase-related domain-containing protein [Chthoniobacterales bacterium]|nr:catalase-related domain-containing protein [Chthoniobacterales bacterium]